MAYIKPRHKEVKNQKNNNLIRDYLKQEKVLMEIKVSCDGLPALHMLLPQKDAKEIISLLVSQIP